MGQESTAGGSPKYTHRQRGSLQGRHNVVNEQSALGNVNKITRQKVEKLRERRSINTREPAEMKSPEPSSVQGVIQHSKSVAGVIKLAASDDPQIVQRHETHRHVGHEHISLHLHDPLRQGSK